jgi:hypothetical protein
MSPHAMFGPSVFGSDQRRKSAMSHVLASDEKYRDSIYGDDHWSRRINKRNLPGDYRFGRTHARTRLSRIGGCLKSMIEMIANSKLRRMERELELQGIRRDRSKGDLVALKSGPTELSQGSK